MKTFYKIYLIFLLGYILIYKLKLIYLNEIFRYIINPLIWIILALIALIFLYKNNQKYYPYSKEVFYKTLSGNLLYIITFYTIGYFIGYGNNPYAKDINGLIINIFSILLVISLKELIRGILINFSLNKNILRYILITIIFILYDLNLNNFFEIFNNFDSIFLFFFKYLLPISFINFFATYICIKGGIYQSIIYLTIQFLPNLIIPVNPNYDYIYLTLFNTLFPLSTFLVINYNIKKKIKYSLVEEYKPSSWNFTFVIVIIFLMFSFGSFSIRPIVILSGSMHPYLKEGDAVIIKNCDINKITEGNIIQFKSNNYTIIHRVIKIKKTSKGIELTTKGDNNTKQDKEVVTADNFMGCYYFKIPYLGYPSYYLHKIINNKKTEVK